MKKIKSRNMPENFNNFKINLIKIKINCKKNFHEN